MSKSLQNAQTNLALDLYVAIARQPQAHKAEPVSERLAPIAYDWKNRPAVAHYGIALDADELEREGERLQQLPDDGFVKRPYAPKGLEENYRRQNFVLDQLTELGTVMEPLQRTIKSEFTAVPRPKIWLSWSSGKDSYAALQYLRAEKRYHVEAIFTVIDPVKNQVPMHAVSAELLLQQADVLGLQIHFSKLDANVPDDFIQPLLDTARQEDVRLFAFGDLFLEEIRQYREDNMVNTGIGTLFPLWQQPTGELIRNLIGSGMRAIITSVDLKALPASFLGRELTLEVVEQIIALGCDPCGENGEYHSFVFDGPLFRHPVTFVTEEPVVKDGFGHLGLKSTEEKPSV